MNIRNLLLGSIAAAGLATSGAYAADLGVLTSLDVCDDLGLSGLTISSDTNCLQVTGEVRYQFNWGDYGVAAPLIDTMAGTFDIPTGDAADVGDDFNNDWESRLRAWIQFAATSNTDFGPAKAVLKLRQETRVRVTNEDAAAVLDTGTSTATTDDVLVAGGSLSTGDTTDGVVLDEAYVSIGDSTVIIAGKKGSIFNADDDAPLTWLNLFNSEDVDTGVSNFADDNDLIANRIHVGGAQLQVRSSIADGFTVAASLENLDETDDASRAGTAIGVLEYKGEGITAHASIAAGGVLDGEVEAWAAHAGFKGTFDNFSVVLAGAFGSSDPEDITTWNVLASASATFDLFTIAGGVEAAHEEVAGDERSDWGAGASIGFEVGEGVKLNLGGRFYHAEGAANLLGGLVGDPDLEGDGWQVAAGVEAAVTETLKVSGEVGFISIDPALTVSTDDEADVEDAFYGKAKLAWAPGGGYTASVAGTVTSLNGYKIETDFKKTFE